jgi:hypothetical protein
MASIKYHIFFSLVVEAISSPQFPVSIESARRVHSKRWAS